ncbi:hypothetical protein D3C84_1116510 [compost metagenome]
MAHRARDQMGGDFRQAEHQAQHDEDGPLHQQQAVQGQPTGEVMHDARYQQRQQTGPQQRDVRIVVGAGREHGHQLRVGVALDPGNGLGHLALFVFSQ